MFKLLLIATALCFFSMSADAKKPAKDAAADDGNVVVNSPGTKIVNTVTVNGRTKGTVTTYDADGRAHTRKVDRAASK